MQKVFRLVSAKIALSMHWCRVIARRLYFSLSCQCNTLDFTVGSPLAHCVGKVAANFIVPGPASLQTAGMHYLSVLRHS
jgi:hypothetical protein